MLERTMGAGDDTEPRSGGPFDWLVVIGLIGLAVGSTALTIRSYVREEWSGSVALIKTAFLQLGITVGLGLAYLLASGVLLALGSVLTGAKLRSVRVFISFQNAYEPIANEIERALARPYLKVIRLPFDPSRGHDDVIEESHDGVRRSDAVVVVPGPEPSWMANELGFAVGLRKPIVVIKHLENQKLSDSLYAGYPTFDWKCLQGTRAEPLARFLAFSTNSRIDILRTYTRIVWSFIDRVFSFAAVIYGVGVAVDGVVKVAAWFSFAVSVEIWVAFMRLYVIASFIGFMVVFARGVTNKWRGIRIARQKIKTQDATYDELSAIFRDSDDDTAMLKALEREPLRPRH